MPDALQLPVAIAVGYLLGSIPFPWLVLRIGFGLDLRRYGSKNVGATNAARVAGQGRRGVTVAVFASVFLLDAAKGLGAVWLATVLAPGAAYATILAGLLAIVGHAFPVWLRFQGGKSVATSLGVFAWLAPVPTAIALGVFGLTIATVRIVSVGSMAAAVALPVAQVLRAPGEAFGAAWPVSALCVAVGVFVIYKHQSNIARLIAGTEGRIGDPPESSEVSQA